MEVQVLEPRQKVLHGKEEGLLGRKAAVCLAEPRTDTTISPGASPPQQQCR
jgi:hypothetical protein